MAFKDFRKSVKKAGGGKDADGGLVVSIDIDVDEEDLQRLGVITGRAGVTGLIANPHKPHRVGRFLSLSEKDKVRSLNAIAAGGASSEEAKGVIGNYKSKRVKVETARRDGKTPFFAFGSEGVRAGHIRLSRSGISLSEKTFLQTESAAIAAAAGQIAGTTIKAIAENRKEFEQAKSVRDYGTAGLKVLQTAGGKLVQDGLSLFGINNLASGLLAINDWVVGKDTTFQDADRRVQALFDFIAGGSRWDYEREHRNKQLAENLRGKRAYLKRVKNATIELKKQFPQDVRSQQQAIIEDLAYEVTDERMMVRDLANRPLWRVANFALNEGN